MREDREEAIVTAAYALLERHSFAGTTMQAVAREAKASMETLYRWYGDKTGLFRALIDRNTNTIAATVAETARDGRGALQRLDRIGPELLDMLLGARAIALNRAAASDSTGTLGSALATGGRGTLLPVLEDIMAQALAEKALSGADAEALTDLWLSLLIGDLQIRRVTGALPPLSESQRVERSTKALLTLSRLYGSPLAR